MARTSLFVFFGLLPGLTYADGLVHTTATLSQARSELAATSAGNLALFAGGRGGGDASGGSDVVDIYDAATETWSTATLSQARSRLAATSVGNYVLFAGGWDGFFSSDVVDIYNTETGVWSTTNLSLPRTDLAAASVGNLAIFAGGWNGTETPSDVVDIFNAETGLWSTATLPQPLLKGVAATAGDKALFADFHAGDVAIYDLQTGLWSTEQPGSSPRRYFQSATSMGSKAFFAEHSGMRVHDDATGEWTRSFRSAHFGDGAAAAIGNKALFAGDRNRYFSSTSMPGNPGFIGGIDLDCVRADWGKSATPEEQGFQGDITQDGFVGGDDLDLVRAHWGGEGYWCNYYDDVNVYDMDAGTWSLETLSEARYQLAATAVGEVALFAGGYTDGRYSDVVDLFQYVPAPPSEPVPEPSAMTAMVLGALVVLLRRRIVRRR